MKFFYSLLLVIFLSSEAAGQTKITDFQQTKIAGPINIKKIDTLNNHLIFIATTLNKNGIWSTDGTAENTKLLTDKNGNSYLPCPGIKTVKFNNHIYLKSCNEKSIARTEGQAYETVVNNIGTIESLEILGERLFFINYAKQDNRFSKSLREVTKEGKMVLIDEFIQNYSFKDNRLFYTVRDATQSRISVCFFDGKKKKVLAEYNDISTPRTVFAEKINGLWYVFFDQSGKTITIVYDENQTEIVKSITWKGRISPENILRATDGTRYLIQIDSENFYQFFKITSTNEVSLVVEVSLTELLGKNVNEQTARLISFGDFNEQRTVYTVADISGVGRATNLTLNKFNFKDKTLTKSESLLSYFEASFGYGVQATPNPNGTYDLDNLKGNKLIYSFDKQQVVASANYDIRTLRDSVATVNKIEILLSDNVYNNQKEALLPAENLAVAESKFLYVESTAALGLLVQVNNNGQPGVEVAAINPTTAKSEQIVSLPNDVLGNRFSAKAIGNKIYFSTLTNRHPKPSVVNFYETDGTKAGTRKVAEADSVDSFYSVFANERQLLHILRNPFNNSFNYYMLQEGSVYPVNIPRRLSKILQTSTKTYNVRAADEVTSQQIYTIEKSEVVVVVKDSYQQVVANNTLYYTTYDTKTDRQSGLFSLSTSATETVISRRSFDTFEIFDNRAVLRNTATNEFVVIDLNTQKEMVIFKANASDTYLPVKFINGALVFCGSRTMTVVRGVNTETILINENIKNQELTAFANGFVIQKRTPNDANDFTLAYYDLAKNELKDISKNTVFESMRISENQSYLIGLVRTSNSTVPFITHYWSPALEKPIEVAGNFDYLKSDALIQENYNNANNETAFWYAENDALKAKWFSKDFLYTNSGMSTVFSFAPQPRFESQIKQYVRDSVINFRNINAQKGGATIGSIFRLGNNLYAYAFTFADGWQVWNMGKVIDNAKQTENILATERTNEVEVTVFPNPTTDVVRIASETPTELTIYTLAGQKVGVSKQAAQHEVSMQYYASGVYLFLLQSQKGVTVRKVVKL